jgi:hypothetical protein
MKKQYPELLLSSEVVQKVSNLATTEHRDPASVCAILIEWALYELDRAALNYPAHAPKNLSQMLLQLQSDNRPSR